MHCTANRAIKMELNFDSVFGVSELYRIPIPVSAAGAEFLLFALPISVIQYMPNFFFGSLLMLFGVEIILDWLIFSIRKVRTCYCYSMRECLPKGLCLRIKKKFKAGIASNTIWPLLVRRHLQGRHNSYIEG